MKLVRVADWRNNYGTGGRLSPQWALADGRPSVPRPVIKNAAAKAKRRYAHRNGMIIAMRQQIKRHGTVNPFYQSIYTPRLNRRKAA